LASAEFGDIEDLIASFDEMVTGAGTLRPHWRGLMQTVWGIAPQQLLEKQARATAQIAGADELVDFRPAAAGATARRLDLLPFVLPEAEWRDIAAGLAQRARLLNAILADLYGPQRLIEDRLVPPRLVFGNPAFLRPLRHVAPVGGTPQLYFYAADLIRLPGGEWRVFSDRTQAAAGVGYALHNRTTLARVFPEAFRAAPARRLQPYLELWRQAIRQVGMSLSGEPRIALLTPGPYNEAYFEHMRLAQELGITLVQSADLTIRGDHVYLKTLQGLLRIDVIYRRIDGDYCDPLELREESELGVPGLVGALRAGNVAVLNMPGTALAGTPGLAAFLPELCRRLLGAELRLPAVTTWWCGQDRALGEVRAALDRFAFQPVFDLDPAPIEPAQLSGEARAAFERRLLSDPGNFVAREKLAPSHAPCLAIDPARAGSILTPQPLVLRAMCLWDGQDWATLPGGVARVVAGPSIYGNALRPGGVTKDVWVIAEDEPEAVPAVRTAPVKAAAAMPDEASLSSRAADDLYWLGRYVERLDLGMRQFKSLFRRLASGGLGPRDRAELGRLAQALVRTGWMSRALALAPPDGGMFLDGVAEAASGGTMLRNCVDSIRRLTIAARDQISLEMWLTLREMTGESAARFGQRSEGADAMLDALDNTIGHIAAFTGLTADSMIRGAGWRFLDLGRRIERGIGVAGSVGGVMTGPPAQFEAGLRLALELCDAGSAYASRYRFESRFAQALELVVADRANPRSLIYQLLAIERHLAHEARLGGPLAEPPSLRREVVAIDAFPYATSRPDRAEEIILALMSLLDDTAGALMALSDAITRLYFSHVASSHLGAMRHRRKNARMP
jgi:uncharacterized circularly permuted ATP-grasp superfamily protein/uncharacterized alpha-E superfamily protein